MAHVNSEQESKRINLKPINFSGDRKKLLKSDSLVTSQILLEGVYELKKLDSSLVKEKRKAQNSDSKRKKDARKAAVKAKKRNRK